MITTIINTPIDCYSLLVESSLFALFNVTTNSKLKLTYTVNCAEPTEIVFDTNINPTNHTILPTGTDTKLCDGIYCLTLEYQAPDVSPTVEGAKTFEYSSVFVSCDTKCAVMEALLKDGSADDLLLYYEVVKLAVTCDNCNCTKACTLFEALNNKINGIQKEVSIENFVAFNDCGCGKSN